MEPICFRDDITIKIDGEGIGFTVGARDYKGVQCVVMELNDDMVHRQWAGTRSETSGSSRNAELYARSAGGTA